MRRELLDTIAVRVFHIPPLRERGREFNNIVREILEEVGTAQGLPGIKASEPAMSALRGYRRPGNVRELRNILARAVAATRSRELGIQALPAEVLVGTIGKRLHLLERLETDNSWRFDPDRRKRGERCRAARPIARNSLPPTERVCAAGRSRRTWSNPNDQLAVKFQSLPGELTLVGSARAGACSAGVTRKCCPRTV